MRFLCAIAILLVIHFRIERPAYANESNGIIFRAEKQLDFVPARALFVLHNLLTGDYLLKNGLLLNMSSEEASEATVALLKQPAKSEEPVHYSFRVLFLNEEGDFAVSSLQTVSRSENSDFLLSTVALEEAFKEKSDSLDRLMIQVREKEKALERLRKDLSIIGSFNKATELEQETLLLTRQIDSAKDQEVLLRDFLKLVKKQKAPVQYTLRKQELAKVAAEVRKAVQDQKEQKGDYSSSQFLSDLSLVEQTRGEDPEKLREELVELRKLRQSQELAEEPARVQPESSGTSGFRSFRSAPSATSPQSSPSYRSFPSERFQNDT